METRIEKAARELVDLFKKRDHNSYNAFLDDETWAAVKVLERALDELQAIEPAKPDETAQGPELRLLPGGSTKSCDVCNEGYPAADVLRICRSCLEVGPKAEG